MFTLQTRHISMDMSSLCRTARFALLLNIIIKVNAPSFALSKTAENSKTSSNYIL